MSTRSADPASTSSSTRRTRSLFAAALASVLLTGMVGAAVPASADAPLPRILLTGGAAQVSRTYTATASDGQWPDGTEELRYQWYRGDREATAESFVPIDGAVHQRYTLVDEDHAHTIKVVVEAYGGSSKLAEKSSATSNWIMYNMAPPVFSGKPHVGETITATVGPWYTEWWTTLTWRRTSVPIPGENGLTYRTRPADAGKEISLLALGEYEFANGVHPIDRYASWLRIRWATKSILRARSTKRGVLRLTTIAYAAGAKQSTVRGRATIFDGQRRIKQLWVPGGRKTFNLRGLRKGPHRITMVFDQNQTFDASKTSRTFTVR